MQALGFSKPISDTGPKKFSAVAGFDDYFFLSGRKYRVIEQCALGSKKGYRVESYHAKSNIPLNIIKVLSYMTVILPLIMSFGKLIARSQHHFFIKKGNAPDKANLKNSKMNQTLDAEKKAKSNLNKGPIHSKGKKEDIKVLPPLDENVQESVHQIQSFKNKALALDAYKGKVEQPVLDFSLTQQQLKCLKLADEHKYIGNPPPGIKIVRGGVNFVFFLDSVPGFVFKPMPDEQKAKNYVRIANLGRQRVHDHNLYLLHVPEAKVVEINGKYFVMQEKEDLLSSTFKGQKGAYTYCWNDGEMGNYMKALFNHLIEFISISGFVDVKYDNIPLSKQGRVALIDIDFSGCPITGLTKGCTGKNDGLLNYIPSIYLDDFLVIAKSHLSAEKWHELEQSIGDLKARAEKKEIKEKDYAQFIKKNSISHPSQAIKLSTIFNDNNKQELAKFIIDNVNKNFSESKNLSIQTGRTTSLGINVLDELTKKAKELFPTLPYFSFDKTKMTFKTVLAEVLEGLKSAGYIYKYKIVDNYNYVKIVC